MLGMTDAMSVVVTTVLMTIVYLAVVRFVDMNEKEPLWAMAMFFALGAVVWVGLSWVASPQMLELNVFTAAVTKEVARFGGIGLGVAAVVAYGQARGWDEFNGTMDGIVYGATTGLGFATAREVTSVLTLGVVTVPGSEVGLLSGFGTAALAGLSHGVFGALIGAGMGAASEARSPVARALYPLVGLLAAIAAHTGYLQLAHGNALAGMQGFVRAHVALALPVLLVVVVAAYALTREKKSIRAYLPEEAASGVVTEQELALLRSVPRREAAYFKYLFTGKLRAWSHTKTLHNLQAQLAFTKERAAGERDAARRARYEQDIAKIRTAVLERKKAFGGAVRPSGEGGAA